MDAAWRIKCNRDRDAGHGLNRNVGQLQKDENRMNSIQSSPLPESALLNRYAQNGSYTDCYHMDIQASISFAEYISSFYTTPLFKVERRILSIVANKPSSDQNAIDLAQGQATDFAAWQVEDRSKDQLLLRDFLGRTRSWLMVSPLENANSKGTRLYFGSAVVPKSVSPAGHASFGFAFHALSGFHRLYTKSLMRAAQANLQKAKS